MVKAIILLGLLGLYNTVPAYGLSQNNDMADLRSFGMDLDVSSLKFNTIVHAVAANENRHQFARRSIYTGESQASSDNGIEQSDGKYRLEKGFLGAHSDIGGGYATGDLSDTALMWAVNQATKSGVRINRQQLTNLGYNKTTNPIVHDHVGEFPISEYKPSRQFLWAEDGKGVSQFDKIAHLKLNWEDTLNFENEKSKKFKKIQQYSKQNNMKDCKKLKASYDNQVLHQTLTNERIKLRDYLKWLRSNGYGI